MKLLSRNKFRESVFDRDNHKCVICGEKGKDAHHILERRLFSDGGYYIDNGSTLCEKHHLEAEMTILSCDEIRRKCNIENIIYPDHLYLDKNYDKWGNIILPNGNRLKGELFFDKSVQKILKKGNVLHLFQKYIKYPRTYHTPFSQKGRSDDRYLDNMLFFEGKEVIVTEKRDGENTTMYSDYIHARSINSGNHPSRNKIKDIWSQIAWEIPNEWRICGENMYAKHTISYDNLDSYFNVFSIWDEKNECLSWDETVAYCDMLNLKTVPVLYKGIYNEKIIKNLLIDDGKYEGYVIRISDSFKYADFKKCVAKTVFDSFKLVHGHWINKKIIPNKLK